MKGSSFGWPFLYFSAVFYGFIGFLLTLPGTTTVLSVSPTAFSGVGNASTDYASLTNMINPFSNIGFLVWLGVAIAFIDAYIIFSSFQVLGTGGS